MSSQDPIISNSGISNSGINSPGTPSPETDPDCHVPRPPCFIGLGANLQSAHGDPAATVLAAAQALVPFSSVPVLLSSLWQTTPVDCPPGSPPFINAVAAIVPLDSLPQDASGAITLLRQLQRIELDFGRERGDQVNAPRALDIDMLCWGDLALQTPELVLPHPRMLVRRFVLEPLAEIAPGLIPPGCEHSVISVLAGLPDQGEIQRIKIDAASVSLIPGVYTTDLLST